MKLKEGEVICKKCEGEGYIEMTDHSSFWYGLCPRCDGRGKLDWVENIVGKKVRASIVFDGTSSTLVAFTPGEKE